MQALKMQCIKIQTLKMKCFFFQLVQYNMLVSFKYICHYFTSMGLHCLLLYFFIHQEKNQKSNLVIKSNSLVALATLNHI